MRQALLRAKITTLNRYPKKRPYKLYTMKEFNWTMCVKKIAIKASLSDIYDAWTMAENMETWFLSRCIFNDLQGSPIDRKKQLENGFTYEWNWFLYEFNEHGKITNANGKDFIQFTFAGECLVDVKLSVHQDMVIVELIQKNIPTDDRSKREIRLGCDSGWSFFFVNLKSVYEGGLDLRNRNSMHKGMVNC